MPSVRVGRHFSASPNNVKDVSSTCRSTLCREHCSDFLLASTECRQHEICFHGHTLGFSHIFMEFFYATTLLVLLNFFSHAAHLLEIVCSLVNSNYGWKEIYLLICRYDNHILNHTCIIRFIWIRIFSAHAHSTHTQFVAFSYFRKCLLSILLVFRRMWELI